MGCGCGSGNQTTTTQSGPPPQVAAAYNTLMQRAGNVAQEPWTPFTGEAVAPINQQQLTGVAGVNTYANAAQPYYGLAGATMAGAGEPLTWDQISNYYSPYVQNVVDKTQAQFDLQNKQALNNIKGNAASAGALGGDRASFVAPAAYYGAVLPQQNATIAGMYDKAYTDAVNTAMQEYQKNPVAFGLSMGQLGTNAQTAGLTGAQSQFAVGSAEQQTQQQQDYFNISQYLAKQGYDFQTAQWLAGIYTGVGSNMGGTSQTTGPAPNQFGQIAGSAIGTFGALAMMSDERAKEGISRIGKTNDGQPIYRFRYKGQPQWYIGLMAQNVERKHPDAVIQDAGSYKMVDIKRATDDAVRASGGSVGLSDAFSGFDAGGAADDSYVPGGLQITHGSGPPKPPSLPSQSGGDAGKSATDAIKMVGALGKIGGYDTGGSPTATGSGLGAPFATSSLSYIPAMQIHAGSGAPPPPGLPKAADNSIAKNAADAARALSAFSKKKSGESDTPGADIAKETPSADLPADMFGSNDANFGGLGEGVSFNPYSFDAFAKKGGRINLPGGLALPGHNRIVMPMRAGMGMPSFVKGYEAGGPPKDYSIGDIIPGSRTVEGDPDEAFDRFTPTDVPLPRPRPNALAVADVPDVITRGPEGGLASVAQPRALGFSPEPEPVTKPPADVRPPPTADVTTDDYAARRLTPRRPAAARPSVGFEGTGLFGIPKDLAYAMMVGGFGAAAAASHPGESALGALSKGALGGVGAYAGIQSGRADIELQSRKLDMEAQKEANRVAMETKKFTELSASQKAEQAERERKAKLEPWRIDEKGNLVATPGGPHDPEVIERETKAKMGSGLDTPEGLEAAANNYRMTGKLPTNMGRGIQGTAQATAIRNRAAQLEIESGGDTKDWPGRWQVFSTRAAGLRSFETRAAGLTLAENEARTLLPRVREASANVSRTNYPSLNSLINAAKQGTGGTDVIKLGIAIESLVPVYARVLKPVGQIGQGDMARAHHLLDKAWSDGQIGAALDQMEVELKSAKDALHQARIEYNNPGGGSEEKKVEFTGRTATGPGGKVLRETKTGEWVQ